ncbi:tetratricopeptide repeat protein, partial [Reichenbachiella sp.]
MKYYLKPIFTMPKYVLAICLLVIISPLFGQEKTLNELNDLAKSIRCTEILKADSISDLVIQKATEMELPSALGTAYLNKGASAVCGGKMDEGISYFKIALNAFNSINDQKGEFEAYELYASVYLRKSMPDSAFHFSKSQLATAEALEDSVLIATAYLTMSSIHTIIAQNDSIVYYALAGLKTLGDIENDNLRGRLNIGLGNAYYQNEDYDLAVKYYTQARQYIDEDDLNMRRIEHNLGSVFTRLKAYDSSFYYLNHTIEINKKNGVKLFLAYNYQSLAENYSASGDCENSIKYNLLALEMSNELNERRSKSGVLGNISKCYLEIGKVEEAIESAKQAVELTKEIGDQDKLADSY